MVSFHFNDITIIPFDFPNSFVSNISREALNRRALQTLALSWCIIDDLSDNNLSQCETNSWLFRGIQCRLSPVVSWS